MSRSIMTNTQLAVQKFQGRWTFNWSFKKCQGRRPFKKCQGRWPFNPLWTLTLPLAVQKLPRPLAVQHLVDLDISFKNHLTSLRLEAKPVLFVVPLLS